VDVSLGPGPPGLVRSPVVGANLTAIRANLTANLTARPLFESLHRDQVAPRNLSLHLVRIGVAPRPTRFPPRTDLMKLSSMKSSGYHAVELQSNDVLFLQQAAREPGRDCRHLG
jgi:hypothetical protein